MRCSNCQTDNPEEADFCIECGSPIEFHCPKCESKTPRKGKFCMKCGYNLTLSSEPISKDLSPDSKRKNPSASL
ncbi:zinc ribbon domain-containing protein [Thermodesulfobacteriota bacterium]